MKTNQKGFTLIELMIVVAIVGILASVGLPSYQSYVSKANGSAALQSLNSNRLDTAEYYSVQGELRGKVRDLNWEATNDGVTVTLYAAINSTNTGIFFTCLTTGTAFKGCTSNANVLNLQRAWLDAQSIVDSTVVGQAKLDVNGDPTGEVFIEEEIAAFVTARDAAKTAYDEAVAY
jgi:prepilin-type N-terminal cleavage/methylation domain-containing protein